MFSFIYTYSLQQPSCIMVAMVLLRCYQHHRCYNHIWAANCKVFQDYLCLEGDPYYIFILQSLQICLELSTILLIMIFLSSFKMTLIIYLFYNLYRFNYVVLACTEYKPINNNPSSLKVIFTFYFTISTFLYQVF